MPTEGKLYFDHLLGILGFSEGMYQFSVDFSFIKHVFLLALLLKCAGLRKTVFRASVEDSGLSDPIPCFLRKQCPGPAPGPVELGLELAHELGIEG